MKLFHLENGSESGREPTEGNLSTHQQGAAVRHRIAICRDEVCVGLERKEGPHYERRAQDIVPKLGRRKFNLTVPYERACIDVYTRCYPPCIQRESVHKDVTCILRLPSRRCGYTINLTISFTPVLKYF